MSESRAARAALISDAFNGRRQATESGGHRGDASQPAPIWPGDDKDAAPVVERGTA